MQEAIGGRPIAVAYLPGVATADVVRAVQAWARRLGHRPPGMAWWQVLTGVLRLPPAVEFPSPAAAADSLRQGYVAVMTGGETGVLLAPTTLPLLVSGPRDASLPPAVRRLTPWVRLLASLLAMTLGPGFVAVTSYHHSLLPGPFIIALASARQNLPFPIVLEVPLVELLGDGMLAAAFRWGGPERAFLAVIGTALAAMAALQAGILAPVPVLIGIASALAVNTLPNPALARAVRIWRYLFLLAAAGLGLFGVALLGFALMVYLAEERALGRPLWLPPAGIPA